MIILNPRFQFHCSGASTLTVLPLFPPPLQVIGGRRIDLPATRGDESRVCAGG